ncbi:MAG TPA: phage tail protein [Acidimicrobiales bacterium]|nr:phage tail protein [Acidimicrobiales bacterium]
MSDTTRDPAVAYMFKVKIDGEDLGLWNSFEGLGMETTIETREEGGNNTFIHQLPGRLKYTNVKISRPVGTDSSKVAKWLSGMATVVTRKTASISALGPDNKEIVSWSLDGVVPVRWTGPAFNVDSPKVAMETLELAYHGFLEAAQPAAGA